MIKVGINGFGRIGRAIFKNAILFDDIEIVAINDINPELENIAYLLKYDSYFGRFDGRIDVEDNTLIIDDKKIKVYQEKNINHVPWEKDNCNLVIESAGKHSLLDELPTLLERGVEKVIVTYSPNDKVDKHIVLGTNEHEYDFHSHNIISSSICDVVALSPVFKIINDNLKVNHGFLTTLHPWLAYQNLLDGPPESWGYPGSLYGHYSLGRASTASLILKPTTAISAAEMVLPGIIHKMKCYSYRVPTPVVGAADITLSTKKKTDKKELINLFRKNIDEQQWPILYINNDPLVSVDFSGTHYSAIIDERWLDVIDGTLIKITLWYDNEFGYSRRVTDLARFLFNKKPKKLISEKNSLS